MSRTMSAAAGGAASSPSPSPDLGGALRETDEYAAAFDLEVWKAQQQLRFQAQLRQAKEDLERRLQAQARLTEQKRLAELEALRQELETMGRRLQSAEEALERRAAQLDAREAAFQAKRVKVAEQHEAYVARAEERERRTREEAALTQSSLQARLQEKDRIAQQLQERLSAAQQEYDLLRRRAARYLTEQTDTDGQRLREQECALALAHTQLAETQRLLRDKVADAERLAEEKVALQGQLRETARQLAVVSRKYHRVCEESQAREWERLRKERDALDAAKRSQALHVNRGGVVSPLRTSHASPTFTGTAGLTSSGPSPADAAAVRVEGRDEFYDMLSALKHEVSAGLAAAAGSRLTNASRALPFKIVEKASSVPRPPSRSGVTPTATAASAPSISRTGTGQRAVTVDADVMESDMNADEMSTVSAALSAIPPAPRSPVSPPPPRHAVPGPAGRLSPGSFSERNVVVDMGDTSMESYDYPRVQLQSWTQSPVSDRAERSAEGEHVVAPLPPPRAGTLPPLAPELRGLDVGGAQAGEKSSVYSAIAPTPEDFVLSREAPELGASSRQTKSQAARREMEGFVQQLKMNREKLLETGVYAEQDRVVQEMGEKIRMYEDYLAQHP